MFFFFSSRRRHTRFDCDWSSDVCSSDLPASKQQVKKFTDAVVKEMRRYDVADQTLGVDFIDINMLNQFGEAKLKWADGMTPMMEARAIKNVDEQECLRVVGAIGDAAHWETMRFLKPGLTENQ